MAIYIIDPDHTYPHFEYDHFGFSRQIVGFDSTRGTVAYDKEAHTGSVEVSIDMKSVNTGSRLFDEHIQGGDFLDTANHPTATFMSTKVNFKGEAPASIEGELTIKGITRKVTLEVTSFKNAVHPMAEKDAIGANAVTHFKRSDFNADKHAPYISDELTLRISLEAIMQ